MMTKKIAAPRKKKPALKAVIDYPTAHEIIRPGHYAIRVTAAGASQAQVRFDGDHWSDCREAAGYFWYDWAAQAGRVRLEVRARAGKGRWCPMAALDAAVKPTEAILVA